MRCEEKDALYANAFEIYKLAVDLVADRFIVGVIRVLRAEAVVSKDKGCSVFICVII